MFRNEISPEAENLLRFFDKNPEAAALRDRIDRLKTTQRQMNGHWQVRHIVKRITGIKKSKAISCQRRQEINGIIDTLDLDRNRNGTERRELLRDFLDMQDNEGKQYTQDLFKRI